MSWIPCDFLVKPSVGLDFDAIKVSVLLFSDYVPLFEIKMQLENKP
jgi:hypothetical protein